MQDSPNERKKKSVLKQLITLFGTAGIVNYAKFIDQNINLSENEIVDKWIQTSGK
jgi:L-rhamnose mutarotase